MSSIDVALDLPNEPLTVEMLERSTDILSLRGAGADVVMLPGVENALYRVGIAVTPRALRRCQRLRFRVFNEELHEGLLASWATGRDADPFDAQMMHLVLMDRGDGQVVGTYRLQTREQAAAAGAHGFYSATQYRLEELEPLLPLAVEAGRACVLEGHRSFSSVMLLWKGIQAVMDGLGRRYLFGCCSITTLDPDDGWRALRTIRAGGALHPMYSLPALESYRCGETAREFDPTLEGALKLPKLFAAYLRLGAQVISEPAVDRAFGTVDFLILLDRQRVTMSAFAGVGGAATSAELHSPIATPPRSRIMRAEERCLPCVAPVAEKPKPLTSSP